MKWLTVCWRADAQTLKELVEVVEDAMRRHDFRPLKTDLILLDPLRHDTPCRVLLGRHEWEPHIPVHLFESGRPWRLLPAEVLETGEDWLLGRCSVVAMDPAGR